MNEDHQKDTLTEDSAAGELHEIKKEQELPPSHAFPIGSQELVHISHIVDPNNFYVQRARDQKLVKDILEKYRHSDSCQQPPLSSIAEGNIYLAHRKQNWLRSRLVTIEKKDNKQDQFIVYCFDIGIIEIVTIENLRILDQDPSSRLDQGLSPPPLAFHCSLANCEPVHGKWTPDDVIFVQSILSMTNEKVILNVQHVVDSEEGIKLHCHVTTYEQNLNVARVLVYHDRARLIIPNLKYPIIETTEKLPQIYKSNSDFIMKTTEEIFITHIISPGQFYVRKKQHENDNKQLHLDLIEEYSCSDCKKIFFPEIDMVCVVNTKEKLNDGEFPVLSEVTWARCVVTRTLPEYRIIVLLVDFGLHLRVDWSSLRVIQPRFIKLKALATECHLAGLIPTDSNKLDSKSWSADCVAWFKKYLKRDLHAHVTLEFNNLRRGSVGVCLYDNNNYSVTKRSIIINLELLNFKYALRRGKIYFPRLSECILQQHKPVLDRTKKPNSRDEESFGPPIQVKEEVFDAKKEGILRGEVKILKYQNPSTIYLMFVHEQTRFAEMFNDIQKYYSSCNITYKYKTKWLVGEKCCAKSVQWEMWCRATILELKEDVAEVFFVDFVTVETVRILDLMILPPEFASLHFAAYKCHLYGVMPANRSWSNTSNEFLKELIQAYKRVYIMKSGKFKDNSMPIEIWVHHVIDGGALGPDISDWRCLNKKLIDQGLGIPIESEKLGTGENGDKTYKKLDDEFLTFENVTGLLSGWLQLANDALPPKADAGNDSSDSEDSNGTHQSADYTDWIPAEPFNATDFTAIPTFIDRAGIIYLHDVAQKEMLDTIGVALSQYSDPDLSPKKKEYWKVGEPCVFQSIHDDLFYRGRVVEVNHVRYTCLVHYIDYGNEETCLFKRMRVSIGLHEVPIQAHKCRFGGIKPVGAQWEKQAIDYVHQLTESKECVVKVVGETVDGVTPINLSIGKLFINNHLVNYKQALREDGSKKKRIRKKKNTSNKETDSGPGFRVEDGGAYLLENATANDQNSSIGRFVTYFIPDEFVCNILFIEYLDVFSLIIIQDEETNAKNEMFQEIQKEADKMPSLDGVILNKACIAKRDIDKQWHRAVILEYSKVRGIVNVCFVDESNEELNYQLVELSDVREIKDEWVNLRPYTVHVRLHGVDVNPEIDPKIIIQGYAEVFRNKGPFHAKIINRAEFLPRVELRNAKKKLVYGKLIEKGLLKKN